MSLPPLIVFTGQGIATADQFYLERQLREGTPEGEDAFRLAGNVPSFDDVFSTCRAKDPTVFARLIATTRQLCRAAREPGVHDAYQRKVFALLAEHARDRAVLHLTTNIDGVSTRVARKYGAPWGPVKGWYRVTDIVREVVSVLRNNRGLAHIPLHGEAGLLAHVADEHAGAQLLWNVPSDFTGPAFSTLAEGVGREVQSVETRMHLAQIGYRLLLSLLSGDSCDVGRGEVLGSCAAADLMTIGYGAGAVPARETYPFERKRATACMGAIPRGRWCALVHTPTVRCSVVFWYGRHGFQIKPFSDADVSATVSRCLDELT